MPHTEHIVAYIGPTLGDGMGVHRHGPTSRRALTDYQGAQIGTCMLTSAWRVHGSHIGTHMHQVHARIEGRDYVGRSWGEGMSVRLRRARARAKGAGR